MPMPIASAIADRVVKDGSAAASPDKARCTVRRLKPARRASAGHPMPRLRRRAFNSEDSVFRVIGYPFIDKIYDIYDIFSIVNYVLNVIYL